MDRQALETMLKNLADVDNHVEPIARQAPPDSDINVLAFAIHNIVVDLMDFVSSFLDD
jgi:hypothetical protein